MPWSEKVLMLTKRAISMLVATSASNTSASRPSGERVSTASWSIHEIKSPLTSTGPEKPRAGGTVGMAAPTPTRIMLVNTESAPASSARNTGAASIEASPRSCALVLLVCAEPSGAGPPSVLSQALPAVAAASAPCPHARQPSAQRGSSSTTAHKPVQIAQNSRMAPISRASHSRS